MAPIPPSPLTPRQRLEARCTLAMLPLGGVLALASVAGVLAAVALGLDALVRDAPNAPWSVVWSIAAAAVGGRNLVGSLRAMSAFSWRENLLTLAWSAAIVATWPGWWLPG